MPLRHDGAGVFSCTNPSSGADQKTLLSFDFYGIMYFTVDYDGRSII